MSALSSDIYHPVTKIRSIFSANIRYLEYEPETDKYGGDIYRKWSDAVQHVETEYSIICIDKAFLTPTWLAKAITSLAENPEYISVYGDSYHIRSRENLLSKNNYFLSQNHLRAGKITLATAHDRLSYVFKDLKWDSNQLFNLTRSDIHKKIHNNILKYQIPDVRYGELILGIAGCMYGNIQFVSGVKFVRDVSEIAKQRTDKRQNSSESSDSRYPYFIVLSKISSSFYDCFISCLNEELTEMGEPNTDVNFQDIVSGFDNREGSKSYKLLQKHPHMSHFWFNYVPYILQDIILSIVKVLAPSLPRPAPSIDAEKYPEFSVIAKIISETSSLHRTDTSIISDTEQHCIHGGDKAVR